MPRNLIFIVFVIAAIGLIAQALLKPVARKARGAITPRQLLSVREQSMFHRIKTVWTAGHVMTQVSMGALLSAKDRATRSTFDRKIVDFVLVNQAFDVVAVIELDDSSHAGKEETDRARDALLQKAGYETLRYASIPDRDRLEADLNKLAVRQKA